MAKKAQSHKSIYRRDDLWIAPSLSLKTKTIKAIGNFREASRMKITGIYSWQISLWDGRQSTTKLNAAHNK
jgi:hypothetical protein